MRARRFLKVKEVLRLGDVRGDDFIVSSLESFDQTTVTGARLPDIERFPLRIVG
jgi:hypothetical protein